MNRRLLGAVLLVVSAAAAVIGTFLPLSVLEAGQFRGEDGLRLTTTAWESRLDPADLTEVAFDATPQYGVPIAVAAVLLAVAAALVFLPEHQRLVARYTALGAGGVLFGAVWAVWASVSASLHPPEGPARDYFQESAGGGIWVLSAAVLVAVAGVVLVHARRAEPRPRGAVVHVLGGEDDDTPPFGIPVIEVAQLPDSDYPGSGPEAPRPDEVR